MNARSSACPGSQPSPVAQRNTASPKEIQTWTCQARVSRWMETMELEGCMNASRRSEGARMMVRAFTAGRRFLHQWRIWPPPVSSVGTDALRATPQQVVARVGPLCAGQPHGDHPECIVRGRRRAGAQEQQGRHDADQQQDPVEPGRAVMLAPEEQCADSRAKQRSEEHTSELQSRLHLVCRLLLEQ